ncbi:hypothetical protein Tco_1483585 [Tanacetum coccineum]
MKKHLKAWRENTLSRNTTRARELKFKLDLLDTKAENNQIVDQDLFVRISFKKELNDLDHAIRLDLMQKSKLKWTLDDDENSNKISGVGATVGDTNLLASILCCQPSSLPFTYLGLPIGVTHDGSCNWKPIIDKFHNRLSWKARSLSFGGRLTLLKSVLELLLGSNVCSSKDCGLRLGIGSLLASNLPMLLSGGGGFNRGPSNFSLAQVIITVLFGRLETNILTPIPHSHGVDAKWAAATDADAFLCVCSSFKADMCLCCGNLVSVPVLSVPTGFEFWRQLICLLVCTSATISFGVPWALC